MTHRLADIGNLNVLTSKRILGVLLALLLAGCGSNVVLDVPTIPTPVIEQLPVSVAVRFPPDFEDYRHEEEVVGREKWSINLGRSNAKFFTELFTYMFEEVTFIGPEVDATLLNIDALIEPNIDAFEFSVPNQSKTEAFAVWIRYRIKVYDRLGTEVASWPVSAYGKSQTTMLGGSEALQRAAVLAMRDAAALMIMQLDKSTGISLLADAPATMPDPAPLSVEVSEDLGEVGTLGEDDTQASSLEGSEDDAS
jgi:hypothetical protein